jgi:hypothetical protein
MIFIASTVHNYQAFPNSRTLVSIPKETLYPLAVTPHSPFLQAGATTNLSSVPKALPILDTSHEWYNMWGIFVTDFCHLT